jgi:CheY-like chemotaxis protein
MPPPPSAHTVLVVDDDAASSQGLALHFQRLGWRVREASTVQEALAALREEPAVLVVSDSSMPDGDGVSFLTRVMAEHGGAVRVFYSGRPPDESVRQALARGVAAGHYVKGQDLAALLELARQLAAEPVLAAAAAPVPGTVPPAAAAPVPGTAPAAVTAPVPGTVPAAAAAPVPGTVPAAAAPSAPAATSAPGTAPASAPASKSAPALSSAASGRSLRLRWRDQRVRLTSGAWSIGRSMTTQIKVPDGQMSRTHAVLRVTDTEAWIEDCESLNGTFVNERRIAVRTAVVPGDRIRLGDTEFYLEATDPRVVLGGSAAAAIPGTLPESGDAQAFDEEPTQLGAVARVPSRPLSLAQIQRALEEREAEEAAARMPTLPPLRPGVQRVLAVLRDRSWGEQIVGAAAIHHDMHIDLVDPAEALGHVATVQSGLLLLDVDAVGGARDRVLRAWRSPPGRGPVLLAGSMHERDGAALAQELGAVGYVVSGKPSILVIGQLRWRLRDAR